MISIGTDLVEIKKFAPLLSKGDFLERCFCSSEITHYKKSNQITYLAGRFAAKEAVVKALGTGLIDGLSFTDIEIFQLPSGAPQINLMDKALELALELGIKKWFISISHTENYATAVVICE